MRRRPPGREARLFRGGPHSCLTGPDPPADAGPNGKRGTAALCGWEKRIIGLPPRALSTDQTKGLSLIHI